MGAALPCVWAPNLERPAAAVRMSGHCPVPLRGATALAATFRSSPRDPPLRAGPILSIQPPAPITAVRVEEMAAIARLATPVSRNLLVLARYA